MYRTSTERMTNRRFLVAAGISGCTIRLQGKIGLLDASLAILRTIWCPGNERCLGHLQWAKKGITRGCERSRGHSPQRPCQGAPARALGTSALHKFPFYDAAHHHKITGTQAAAGHCLADGAQGLLSKQHEIHRMLPGNTSPPAPSSVSLQAHDIISLPELSQLTYTCTQNDTEHRKH